MPTWNEMNTEQKLDYLKDRIEQWNIDVIQPKISNLGGATEKLAREAVESARKIAALEKEVRDLKRDIGSLRGL
jgi:polyhydroxyalkanoate synthesis regulator phasin